MNKFTPGQRSEIARLIKKAKAKQIEKLEKIIRVRSFEHEVAGKIYRIIDTKELKTLKQSI